MESVAETFDTEAFLVRSWLAGTGSRIDVVVRALQSVQVTVDYDVLFQAAALSGAPNADVLQQSSQSLDEEKEDMFVVRNESGIDLQCSVAPYRVSFAPRAAASSPIDVSPAAQVHLGGQSGAGDVVARARAALQARADHVRSRLQRQRTTSVDLRGATNYMMCGANECERVLRSLPAAAFTGVKPPL